MPLDWIGLTQEKEVFWLSLCVLQSSSSTVVQCLVLLSTVLALSGVTVGVVQAGIFSLILKTVLFIYLYSSSFCHLCTNILVRLTKLNKSKTKSQHQPSETKTSKSLV